MTGHSTPAVRAISEIGAHQHCSAISDVCIRYVYVYVFVSEMGLSKNV